MPKAPEPSNALPMTVVTTHRTDYMADGSVVDRPFPNLPAVVAPAAKFDRNAYQAAYMRDQRKAKKLGLTVAEYRARKPK